MHQRLPQRVGDTLPARVGHLVQTAGGAELARKDAELAAVQQHAAAATYVDSDLSEDSDPAFNLLYRTVAAARNLEEAHLESTANHWGV